MALRIGELKPPAGARRRRKRVGRGLGSGKGTYAGRGIKGQKARSGKGPRPGFEGGQTPLGKRLPFQRGIRAYGSSHTGGRPRPGYVEVQLTKLARFEPGTEVTPEVLLQAGLVSGKGRVKVLGPGRLPHPLTVKAHAFSASARAAIEAAGGRAEVIP
ncbi:MAG: 50S ribosomal protein L15 [Armatimonadota bacterium]|nr:50S ribosomal protein L15 [Armatimonadota bacterium]MDW8156767.1 50S ribosomal protein L15 [Armatimonadota bacterium]